MKSEASKKRDREQKRLVRMINKHLYGVQEPGRAYLNGRDLPRRTVDPDDYGHPLSDVRLGA